MKQGRVTEPTALPEDFVYIATSNKGDVLTSKSLLSLFRKISESMEGAYWSTGWTLTTTKESSK